MGLFPGDSGGSGLGISLSRSCGVSLKVAGRLTGLESHVSFSGIGLILGDSELGLNHGFIELMFDMSGQAVLTTLWLLVD